MYTNLSQDRIFNKRKIDDEFDTAKNHNHIRKKKKSNVLMMQHPLGIKPWGNYYFDSTDKSNNFEGDCRCSSLGNLVILTDDLILEILGVLDAKDLLSLGLTSRVLYCFSTFDDLWKRLIIQKYNGDWCWQGNWRVTFLKRSCSTYNLDLILNDNKPAIHLTNFYSDTLFQPFLCSSTRMESYLGVENIDR